MEPSPEFKRILDAAYELQLDGKVTTLDEAIDVAKKMMSDG
jgi:hypothetical protein